MQDLKNFDLSGKTVLVTGGAGFLGYIFGKALVGAGATVILGDVRDAEKAAKEIGGRALRQAQGKLSGVGLDVTNKASIEEVIAAIVKEHGRLDVVVNNAGLDPKFDASIPANKKTFEEYPEEFIRKSLDVNLLGATLVAQAAVKKMLTQGSGNIINISSLYGINGPDQRIYPAGTQKPVDYSISKGGLVMLTKWLATSYGAQGIRSNTLTLGGVLNNHPTDFRKAYGNKVPNGKMVSPEEIGATMIYLTSDASSAMNGHNLVLDHGFSAW